ncbi:SDR family oxidoreductase [Candidatus Dojkabacteria bacterium]|nr:SDR family oxidoreductase [Candidatus Dojkabacteria bacterium]
MNFKEKRILITGGTSGLGLSIAKALIAERAIVHVISHRTESITRAVKEVESKDLFAHLADVSNFKDLESVSKKVGAIDILINNAGIWLSGELEENSPEEISRVIDVNLKGVIFSTKAFLPNLEKSKSAFILNVCSTSGLKPRENQFVYTSTKFGVAGFIQSLQLYLQERDIKVSNFYPGGMNTSIFGKAGDTSLPSKDWMDTEKVAEVVLNILSVDKSMLMDQLILKRWDIS